ncbi:ImmA/IrrE family metallo-endopeptidase [Catellatospora sichuanensis]|uniref:ImmA/IrrE family metallo-endopeptidase n=1 Tax=Catellatospora sichuanensis TaxID=1969805 RepID=UPI0011829CB6|nr:hypothetical protein [Catellatospora sichuanensis]
MKTLEVRIEWLDAPSVVTPELAATWARYEIWVGDTCITQVETGDGTYRRSVFGSLYPLAEWIATNWWVLNNHIRPSAIDTRYWSWANVSSYSWLRQHNFRAAGDGMPWPNLTVVPEGAVSRLVWRSDSRPLLGPIRFAANGNATLKTDDVLSGLAAVVEHVLERLAESGQKKTQLAEEWSSIASLDDEESAFCTAVARLGLDPFSVSNSVAEEVIEAAASLPEELRGDFLDTADIRSLTDAAAWARQALTAATDASNQPIEDLSIFYAANSAPGSSGPPWALGYAIARKVRQDLAIAATDPFDPSPWVGVSAVNAPSRGIQGIVTVKSSKCGLAFPGFHSNAQRIKFRQAQAIGRIVAEPDRAAFLMSPAHSYNEKVARAFAAELLAPAAGMRVLLGDISDELDTALEQVADSFAVPLLVVQHQYENQLAKT